MLSCKTVYAYVNALYGGHVFVHGCTHAASDLPLAGGALKITASSDGHMSDDDGQAEDAAIVAGAQPCALVTQYSGVHPQPRRSPHCARSILACSEVGKGQSCPASGLSPLSYCALSRSGAVLCVSRSLSLLLSSCPMFACTVGQELMVSPPHWKGPTPPDDPLASVLSPIAKEGNSIMTRSQALCPPSGPNSLVVEPLLCCLRQSFLLLVPLGLPSMIPSRHKSQSTFGCTERCSRWGYVNAVCVCSVYDLVF